MTSPDGARRDPLVEVAVFEKRSGACSVLDELRDLVVPLASGAFVTDWAVRAAAVSAMSDVCFHAAREDGHWSPGSASASDLPLSLTPTRTAVLANQRSPEGRASVSLNLDLAELTGHARDLVAGATAGLDAAEKVVISAAAYSLCQLANPPELVVEVMNILFEEALHLNALGRLLGTDHSQADWIPEDRRANWELVQLCTTPIEYMLLEHCLYEGRGTIASAAGALHLERLGAPAYVVDVFTAISKQEANHNISGFRWLKVLDDGTDAMQWRLAAVVRSFLEAEPLPEPDGTARSLRKHFPLYLLQRYRSSSDFYQVKGEIVAASRAARLTGEPGVPFDQLYAASEQAVQWSLTQ